MKWHLWIIVAGFLCGLTGCTAEDKAGVSIDLSNLNWQTIAIIGAALLTPFQSLLKPVLTALQPIINILQKLGILRKPATPDDTPLKLTIEELIAILTDLLTKTEDDGLKAQIHVLIGSAAGIGQSAAMAKGVASASKSK
jgi:hypothetical protein